MKIIVSLRRKHHFANFPMEFSNGMCTHLRLEKSPSKRIENQCWMILNPHFEPRPSMRRVPSFKAIPFRKVSLFIFLGVSLLRKGLCLPRLSVACFLADLPVSSLRLSSDLQRAMDIVCGQISQCSSEHHYHPIDPHSPNP